MGRRHACDATIKAVRVKQKISAGSRAFILRIRGVRRGKRKTLEYISKHEMKKKAKTIVKMKRATSRRRTSSDFLNGTFFVSR